LPELDVMRELFSRHALLPRPCEPGPVLGRIRVGEEGLVPNSHSAELQLADYLPDRMDTPDKGLTESARRA
jgi:hypothetical protein